MLMRRTKKSKTQYRTEQKPGKVLLAAALAMVLLAGCSTADNREIRRPSGSASKMSSDTLCYRYAYAKTDGDIAAEVRARGLDCAAMLGVDDPSGGY